uniref:Uncharacterized protein n=1 Tax=Amphimedon queenslandica TaxID=400682 RepID=A0A1X7VDC7_AMPQE
KLLQNKLCVYYYDAVVYSNGAYIPVKQRENTHHLRLFVLYKIFAEYTQPGHILFTQYLKFAYKIPELEFDKV